VRILKDLKRAVSVSADSKGVTGAFRVSADSKGVTGEIPEFLDGVESREDGRQRNISHYTIFLRIVKWYRAGKGQVARKRRKKLHRGH
jgi:hypothetical protein